MKSILLALLLLGMLPLHVLAKSETKRELVDRIVAIIDGTPILASKVHEKMTSEGVRIDISDYPADDKSDNASRALNDAINAILIERKIKELELKVTSEQINQQIQRILTENQTTLSQLESYLEQQGKTMAQYRADLTRQMQFYQFRGRVLMPLVRSMKQKDVYRKNSEALEVEMRLIFVKSTQDMSPQVIASKKKTIFEAYDKIKGGTDFLEAEKIYSELETGRHGDKASTYRVADLRPELKEAIFKVSPSDSLQVTEPVLTPTGWHIFYILKREYPKNVSQETEETLATQQRLLEQQLRVWLGGERSKANIELINL